MPVILAAEDYAPWLDPDFYQPQILQAMLRPYEADAMDCYPISTAVNKPQHDTPDCITALPPWHLPRRHRSPRRYRWSESG